MTVSHRIVRAMAVGLVVPLFGCERSAPPPAPPPTTATAARPPVPGPRGAAAQADSRRECAVCHLSWVESFEIGRARRPLLIDHVADSSVSDADACLGCHDGSVADSRERVWLKHGHETGAAPPPTMKVPEQLPLADGKLACRTCHTAHAGRGPENLANTVFVRVPNENSELCQMCHPEKAGGPGLGTHPVGGMPWPVPDALIAAGAKTGSDRQRLICQTCHMSHGSPEERLLVMGTESSQLCLACHAQLRPGLWSPDTEREHPQNPPLKLAVQREAIRDMGTTVGRGDTLICLSCHKLHDGLAGRNMLADTLHDSSLCIRCHPDRKTMVGTRHDLRRTAPRETNRLGQTPEQSGPCGACHSFHQFARKPTPQRLDPSGLCATCHRPGQCAARATGEPFSHPADIGPKDLPPGSSLSLYARKDGTSGKELACLTCHDPHEAGHASFLRTKPDRLCAECHSANVASVSGAHDFTRRTDLVNGRGQTASQAGTCGFCHGIHNANGPMLWVATKETPRAPDGLCRECHRDGGLAGNRPGGEVVHPSGAGGAKPQAGFAAHLPRYDADGRKASAGGIACATCHDPHVGFPDRPALLRRGSGDSAASLCTDCHTESQWLTLSLHNPRVLKVYPGADRLCGPCHVVHASQGVAATGTWAGPLGSEAQPFAIRRCTGCHGPNGGAPQVDFVEHPIPVLQNVAAVGKPGYLPLLNEHGEEGAEGRIVCTTCHVPHGRAVEGAIVPEAGGMEFPGHVRGVKRMLRSYEPPNLCSSCHGFDGLRRYLYFHAPEKRRALAADALGALGDGPTRSSPSAVRTAGPESTRTRPER